MVGPELYEIDSPPHVELQLLEHTGFGQQLVVAGVQHRDPAWTVRLETESSVSVRSRMVIFVSLSLKGDFRGCRNGVATPSEWEDGKRHFPVEIKRMHGKWLVAFKI